MHTSQYKFVKNKNKRDVTIKSIITKKHYKRKKKVETIKKMAKNPFSSLYFHAIPTLVPIFYFHRF